MSKQFDVMVLVRKDKKVEGNENVTVPRVLVEQWWLTTAENTPKNVSDALEAAGFERWREVDK